MMKNSFVPEVTFKTWKKILRKIHKNVYKQVYYKKQKQGYK